MVIYESLSRPMNVTVHTLFLAFLFLKCIPSYLQKKEGKYLAAHMYLNFECLFSFHLSLCVSFRVWPQTCLLQKHLHPSAMVSLSGKDTFTHKCYWYSISCNIKCEREHWHSELDTGLIFLFNWLLKFCVFCLFQGRTASSPKQRGWVSHHNKQETCKNHQKKSNFNPGWLWIYVTVLVCFRSSAHRWWRNASPVWRLCTRWRDWWLLNMSTTKAASDVFTAAQISG